VLKLDKNNNLTKTFLGVFLELALKGVLLKIYRFTLEAFYTIPLLIKNFTIA